MNAGAKTSDITGRPRYRGSGSPRARPWESRAAGQTVLKEVVHALKRHQALPARTGGEPWTLGWMLLADDKEV